MSLRRQGNWVVVERFSDVPTARTYAARLVEEGVPAEVEADTPILGELRPAEVVVPQDWEHRARWLAAQWSVPEAELTRQALGGVGDEHEPDGEAQLVAASTFDAAGMEAQAIPLYQAALRLGLPEHRLREAYVGLGSSYRVVGRLTEALDTFDRGLEIFVAAPELTVFRAMVLYNLGRSKEAVQSLLTVVADVDNPELRQYAKAIALYAQDIDLDRSGGTR